MWRGFARLCIFLLSAWGQTGCGEANLERQTAFAPSADRPDMDGRASSPAAPGSRLDPWFSGTVSQALVQAKALERPIFIDVGAYWCPPCHRLMDETFADPGVARLLASEYVAVSLDAEKGEGPRFVEEYNISEFPTMLVLDVDGNELGRLGDFLGPAALPPALEDIRSGPGAVEQRAAEVELTPDDLESRLALGRAYARAAERAPAEAQYTTVDQRDPENSAGLKAQVAYDRALLFTFVLAGDPGAAIDELRDLQRLYPGSAAARRAFLPIAQLQHAQGQTDQAMVTLEDALAASASADKATAAAEYGWFSVRERVFPDRALPVVEQAAAKSADWADLHHLAAQLSLLAGVPVETAGHIGRALALEPKSHFYKGEACRLFGLAAMAGGLR